MLPGQVWYRKFAVGLVFFAVFSNQASVAEESMSVAATNYLSALSVDDREQSVFSLDDEERLNWHFVPHEMFPRSGILLKQLNPQQREFAQTLLASGLSERGYLTVTSIIQLERVLNALEPDGPFVRDYENYRVSVFSTPESEGSWGWRFEGHHLSLHFTIVAGEVTVSSPTFLGSNPAEVRSGAQTEQQQNQRVLAAREDSGRSLVTALSDLQRTRAITSDTAPRDIVTGAQYPIDPLTPAGIRAGELNDSQQQLLRDVIDAYTATMSAAIAEKRWSKIREQDFGDIHFAWSGPVERGEAHYYRVQGESFLIEYDNVQNGANHVHSVWRDFEGDFGADALRDHYDAVAH